MRLVRDDGTGRRVGRIVELEAYLGPDDLASHARFGPTKRNRAMFGPPGRAYVYLVYGMHDCLNLVTEPDGEPAALLVRAIEPIEGTDLMRAARIARWMARRRDPSDGRAAAAADRITRVSPLRLASGPGSVTSAFGVDTSWTGIDLCDPSSPLRLEPSLEAEASPVVGTTPRIGIDYAGEPWTGRPWRFVERGHPSVSGPVAGR